MECSKADDVTLVYQPSELFEGAFACRANEQARRSMPRNLIIAVRLMRDARASSDVKAACSRVSRRKRFFQGLNRSLADEKYRLSERIEDSRRGPEYTLLRSR